MLLWTQAEGPAKRLSGASTLATNPRAHTNQYTNHNPLMTY